MSASHTDCLYRGQLPELNIRFSYALTTQLANEAVLLHETDPLSSHLLGRALTAGAMISPLLVEGERFALAWRYGGAAQNLTVQISDKAQVRGYITNPNLMSTVESEDQLYGEEGTLNVIKSNLRQTLSNGTVDTMLMEVVDDLAFYYCTSEQVETAMTVMIGFQPKPSQPVTLCQGMMIQALPGCDLEIFERLRKAMGSDTFRELLAKPPAVDNHVELALRALALDDDVQDELLAINLHACPQPVFHCDCSHERTLPLLKTLGDEELKTAVDNGESMAIRCQFCNRRYEFGTEELATLL